MKLNRFNQLLESKMGDVRPLIMEEKSSTLSEFALQEIKPYLEDRGYRVGLFGNVSDIPMEKMKDNKLAALALDGPQRQLTIVLSNDDEASSLLGMSDDEEGEIINDLGISTWENAEEGEPTIMDRRYYGDGLALVLTTKF